MSLVVALPYCEFMGILANHSFALGEKIPVTVGNFR